MSMSRRLFLALPSALISGPADRSAAQAAGPAANHAANQAVAEDPTFRSDVKVVSIIASVRDKSGKPIRDLEKNDFAITENGKGQSIRYFSRETGSR